MKIAIFHNFMDNMGGAEMVCLTLARELGADIYTTNIDMDKIAKMGFPDSRIISIGSVPNNAPFRQQAALFRFRTLNLGGKYDFYIIGGDWAVSAAVNHKPNLWYVHSPPRELWDLYSHIRENLLHKYKRFPYDAWVFWNRLLYRKYVREVDTIACNSKNVQERIKKYLGRDASVVYPPVDTSLYYFLHNGNFWLSVNRLFAHKRIEMQMRAFAKLPEEQLVIVGSYEKSSHFQQYVSYIESITSPNVRILSWVDAEMLRALYARCKGFITTSKDEDFGMSAVEAMAAGKPVIAPNEGGYCESVVDGITGKLIMDIDEQKLIEAIKVIGKNPKQFKNACLQRAKEFDTNAFIREMRKLIFTTQTASY